MIQPVRQRGVDIDELAGRIDREEAARRMIEIFDRVLQLLEHILLPFAVAGDVGDRPHRVFSLALALAERPNPHPQPAAVVAVGPGDADFLLLPLAFARRLEQAKHRLRHIGIADENPLHGTDVLRGRSPRQRQIGRVGIDHMAAGVGDRQSVIGMIGNAAHHRVVGGAVGKADDSGGIGEQVEQPDHRQQRQQRRGYRAAPGRGRWSSARPPPRRCRRPPAAPARCCRPAAPAHGRPAARRDGSLSGSAVMAVGRSLSMLMRRAFARTCS